MKEKLKQTKGITLIALIITIIVLLILAMVSIRLIMNAGIIGKAQTATETYGIEEEKEQIKLAYADYQMAKESGEANPTLDVAGASEVQESDESWTITFEKTGNVYTLSADGKTITPQGGTSGENTGNIDFEAIKSDVLANKEAYLAKADAAGQDITSNKDIGIGTDGNIVNLDLWNYEEKENAICIYGQGSGESAYSGKITNGKIEGTVPQYILSETYGTTFMEVRYLSGYSSTGFMTSSELTSITLPSTVVFIGNEAFEHCPNLQEIVFSDNLIQLYSTGLDHTQWFKNQPDGMVYIGNVAFKYKGTVPASLEIKDGTKSIADSAFDECSELENVKIPDSVVRIGRYAFYGCTSIKTLIIPKSVTMTGDGLFARWTDSQTVYCRASSTPSEWDDDWDGDPTNFSNKTKAHVEWGYTGS